jgi:hypothetical protein
MADYSLKLTPSIRNIDSEGSLDTSVLNGESIQRTVNILEVVDGSGNKKVIGVVKDGQSFNDIVEVSTPTPEPTLTPTPVTLYFNGAVDDAWTTVGNWWLDAVHTEPAGRLPTSVDSVVVDGTNTPIVASGQTVVDFTMDDEEGNDFYLYGTLTVTGIATFNGVAKNAADITGNATFNSFSLNDGTIVGNATFNVGSSNVGSVTGTATFNDNACNNPLGGTAGTFVPDPPPACF